MIPRFTRLVIGLLTATLLVAACTSSDSGSGLSEDDAAESVDAVVVAFESAADEAGFDEDDDDDDDDEPEFDCEGFEAFDEEGDSDPIASAELSVTDGGEPEPTGVDDNGQLTFEGGEVTGGVEASVLDDSDLDSAIEAIDAVLEDREGFAECFEDAMSSFIAEDQEDPSFEIEDFSIEVEVDEGDTGDQEMIIELDGSFTITGQGFSAEFPLGGEFRLIRIGQAGLMLDAFTFGDADADALDPAIDAAIDEFEAQFG